MRKLRLRGETTPNDVAVSASSREKVPGGSESPLPDSPQRHTQAESPQSFLTDLGFLNSVWASGFEEHFLVFPLLALKLF